MSMSGQEDATDEIPLTVGDLGSSTPTYQPFQAPVKAPVHAIVDGYPAGRDVEALYLLQRQDQAPRAWRGHWCAFWGLNQGVDWLSCVLVWALPCLPFGMNAGRALHVNWLKHTVLYGALVVAVTLLCAGQRVVCPAAYDMELEEDGNDDEDGRHTKNTWDIYGNKRRTLYEYYGYAREGYCNMTAATILAVTALVCGIALVVYAARTRTALRERLHIPGSALADGCTWLWCGCCALTQETRTLAAANVYDGTWHGPLVAPVVPGMVPSPLLSLWERVLPGTIKGGMRAVALVPMVQQV
eukprot:CAMPEP_0202877254 /NCGR_PEP_ID=MMETSP1391-20130828/30353_1 /ASSEMBLY_ACC=CAM_ASM_000867 /TAXON_ID=1034604 /ORGANISM="Chlamydomonas leiostraca, Strain SAG 11-49" /LENGTH=298 /DNA_ID=CAMNT_0049559255 /DNA_START=141 /DNA_END=1037 /DNA_ORIENTATION=-